MWIRSQDKEILIKVDGLKIEKNKIVIETCVWYIVLGEYSTEEKALKVMDMIEKYINKVEEFKAQGEDIQENYLGYGNSKARLMGFTFQMPQDSEVE